MPTPTSPYSLIQLPWNKEIGWLASDLYMDGKPVKASPRVMLKEQIKKMSQKKLQMKSGVECEYFLISEDGASIADQRDIQSKCRKCIFKRKKTTWWFMDFRGKTMEIIRL